MAQIVSKFLQDYRRDGVVSGFMPLIITLRANAPISRLFLQQANITQNHAAIRRLAHVVDVSRAVAYGGQASISTPVRPTVSV